MPQRFTLSYVEFDDGGEMWSIGNQRGDRYTKTREWPTSQLEQSLKAIKEAREDADRNKLELLVVTFVHGWHNDASVHDETKDQNLFHFKQVLQGYASDLLCRFPQQGRCRVVVGVFLSWRGKLAESYAFLPFTYANRRNTANRVGGVSMTEAILSLAFVTKGVPPPYLPKQDCNPLVNVSDGPKRRFIIVGHSFGGRVLMHGVAQAMLALLLERKAQAEACIADRRVVLAGSLGPPISIVDPPIVIVNPVDLIVILNPADDALASKSLVEAFKRAGITDEDVDHPLIVEVKSDADFLTGWVMKTAQIISGSKFRNRVYDPGLKDASLPRPSQLSAPPAVPSACEEGQLGLKVQRFYYDHSAGGIYDMASHYIEERDNSVNEKACTQANALFHNDPVFWSDSGRGGHCYEVIKVKSILDEDAGRYNSTISLGGAKLSVNPQQFYSCRPELVDGKDVPVPVWNNTPFYIMHAPKDLIVSHEDIFAVGVLRLILNFSQSQPKTILLRPSAAPAPGNRLSSNPQVQPGDL